jgi:spermidine synthase/MFS family permease
MGSDTTTPAVSAPLSRLAGVGLIIFFANAALLVLQLVAGRLLAPFVGSSLETWTSVIGVFLTGIALGNALGGRIADRYPSPRTLAILLAVGALAALWMLLVPLILASTEFYKTISLGPRIPLLAVILCLPAGFVLSLLTPLAIKLGLPDVSKTGSVAGMIFALSTLGCLLGNYLTGFVLMKAFTINELVYGAAGTLVALAVMTLVILRAGQGAESQPSSTASEAPSPAPAGPVVTDFESKDEESPPSKSSHAFSDIRVAFAIVFLASFGGMTLELTASRVLAQQLGVSLFTWTGIIGVMLAGTALGNFTGGLIADRVNRPKSEISPRTALACTLMLGGGGTVVLFVTKAMLDRNYAFHSLDPISQVMGWTFSLFFLPMYALGMVSPQVIRLAVPDLAVVGRVAGRVYAWSTVGAIVGTFAAGYVLLSTFGMYQTLLTVALVLTLTTLLVAKVWDDNVLLYAFSIVLGGVTGGFILIGNQTNRERHLVAQVESNYYTIRVTRDWDHAVDQDGKTVEVENGFLVLTLDHLIHSSVDPERPNKLHYPHEYVQMELLRSARAANPHPRVLVIGGGGYTYPRYAMEVMPETRMDVVEIDPGVTRVAREYLGLKAYEGMHITHMDGRQFVAEKAEPGTYDLVIQDAVNDLSVPSHLLTKEYNDLVKRALKPNGVYLLTVIDAIGYGQLWKAAIHTLQQTYPPANVTMLAPEAVNVDNRQVYVIYASDKPFNLNAIRDDIWRQQNLPEAAGKCASVLLAGGMSGLPESLGAAVVAQNTMQETMPELRTSEVSPALLKEYLDVPPKIILTDQYAPVDNLMADVFRYRYRARK